MCGTMARLVERKVVSVSSRAWGARVAEALLWGGADDEECAFMVFRAGIGYLYLLSDEVGDIGGGRVCCTCGSVVIRRGGTLGGI